MLPTCPLLLRGLSKIDTLYQANRFVRMVMVVNPYVIVTKLAVERMVPILIHVRMPM